MVVFLGVISALTTSCAPVRKVSGGPALTQKSSSQSLWSAVNSKGRVDYQFLVDSPEAIREAYRKVSLRSPESHPQDYASKDEQLAYWLNAYNISVIYGVTELYPIKSVRDHRPLSFYSLFAGGGFFAGQKFVYGGRRYSLYHLENKIIRKQFDDPRIHFGLNCASISCPQLAPEPFRGAVLDSQLEALTREFINSSEAVQIDHQAEVIRLSAIFKWYEEDFENGVLPYIRRYLPKAQDLQRAEERGYRVEYLPYNWSLNGLADR